MLGKDRDRRKDRMLICSKAAQVERATMCFYIKTSWLLTPDHVVMWRGWDRYAIITGTGYASNIQVGVNTLPPIQQP